MFEKILNILTVPLLLLNMGGGIVGGIWLAIRGEWRLIGVGVLLLFTFHLLLSIIMIPGIAISGLAVVLHEKKNPLWILMGFLSQLYTNLLILGTCVFAFYICSKFYKGDAGNIGIGYIPYLLWSWGMALGPWQYFASKEPNNEFSTITLFWASIFYMLFLISLFISPFLVMIVIFLFVLVQLLILPVFNTYLANKLTQNAI